ncbi:MAG: hypothetical protein ACPLTO_12530, partial [Thermanaerothrix sp.]
MHEPIEHPQPFEHWRLTVFYVLVGLVIGFYILRLFNLQILQGTNYRVRAEDNRTMEISTPTQRGLIYDRNGYLLAKNVPSYNVVITPAELPIDEGGIQEVYRQLSQLIGVPVNNGEINEETVRNFTPCATDLGIAQIVYIGDTNAPYSPIRIKC